MLREPEDGCLKSVVDNSEPLSFQYSSSRVLSPNAHQLLLTLVICSNYVL